MKFQIYPEQHSDGTPSGQWRWRLVADNGRITADGSEPYVSKSNCRKAIHDVEDALQFAGGCIRAKVEVLEK